MGLGLARGGGGAAEAGTTSWVTCYILVTHQSSWLGAHQMGSQKGRDLRGPLLSQLLLL